MKNQPKRKEKVINLFADVAINSDYNTYFYEFDEFLKILFSISKNDYEQQKISDLVLNKIRENIDDISYIISILIHLFKVRLNYWSFILQLFQNIFAIIPQEMYKCFFNYIHRNNQFISNLILNNNIIDSNMIKLQDSSSFSDYLFDNNSLEYFILKDDFDKFLNFFVENPTLNSKTYECNVSLFGENDKFIQSRRIDMISLASLYGSITIFKNLFLNDCIPSNKTTLAHMAIAGGDFEIIHILEQIGVPFQNCFNTSVIYNRYDISDWLLTNYNITDMLTPSDCLLYFNYPAFFYSYLNGNNITRFNALSLLQIVISQGNLIAAKFINERICIKYTKTEQKSLHPIHQAANTISIPLLRYLLDTCGFDINEYGHNARLIIHIACIDDNIQLVKYLIEEKNVDKEKSDIDRETPLYLACLNGNSSIVKYLIEEQHVNIHCKNKIGVNCLHAACLHGHFDIIKYLCENYKFDIDSKTDFGKTPLHYACMGISQEIILYLIEQQHADVEAEDKLKKTPLLYSCELGHLEIVKLLLEERHVNKEARDNNGWGMLHFAVAGRNEELIKYLIIEQKVNINEQDKQGNTSLHIAVEKGSLEVVKLLVSVFKIDVTIKNNERLTAFELALNKRMIEIIKFLSEASV